MGSSAHYARAQPHADRRSPAQGRIRVKDPRGDLRAQPCAHFKGGLRSKPPAGTYTYIRDIYTHEDTRHEPATKTEGLAELAYNLVKEKMLVKERKRRVKENRREVKEKKNFVGPLF